MYHKNHQKIVKLLDFSMKISNNLLRVDAMKCQILLQKKSLHEMVLWLETIKMKKILITKWFHYSAINIMSHKIVQISIIMTKFSLIFQTSIYFTMMTTTMSTYPLRYIQASNLPWGHIFLKQNSGGRTLQVQRRG